jgi:hypothetical protein
MDFLTWDHVVLLLRDRTTKVVECCVEVPLLSTGKHIVREVVSPPICMLVFHRLNDCAFCPRVSSRVDITVALLGRTLIDTKYRCNLLKAASSPQQQYTISPRIGHASTKVP